MGDWNKHNTAIQDRTVELPACSRFSVGSVRLDTYCLLLVVVRSESTVVPRHWWEPVWTPPALSPGRHFVVEKSISTTTSTGRRTLRHVNSGFQASTLSWTVRYGNLQTADSNEMAAETVDAATQWRVLSTGWTCFRTLCECGLCAVNSIVHTTKVKSNP